MEVVVVVGWVEKREQSSDAAAVFKTPMGVLASGALTCAEKRHLRYTILPDCISIVIFPRCARGPNVINQSLMRGDGHEIPRHS